MDVDGQEGEVEGGREGTLGEEKTKFLSVTSNFVWMPESADG